METLSLHNRFQKKLREALEVNGWSQRDLAKSFDCAPQMVSQYLSGKRMPGLDVVEKFAIALGLPDAASLIDNSELRQPVA
jgi:transcriptional regulator with XRE-family HTH domain